MDTADIRHLAALAELSLAPAEAERLAADLTRLVAYVSELAAVDTSDVAPMTMALSVEVAHAHRADSVAEGLARDAALAAAPATDDGGFLVPGFVE